MRNSLAVSVLVVLAAGAALAQPGPPRTYGSPLGFGSVLYPGMGTPPPFPTAQFQTNTSFAHSLGMNVAGRAIYANPWPGPNQGRGRAAMVVPYAVPVFVGGYGYGYGSGYQEPNVTYMVQQSPPPSPAPQVVINQSFGNTTTPPTGSVMREYQASGPPATEPAPAPPAAAEEKPTIYLLALTDGSVYSALAYWVEDGALHYITTGHAHNRASLELVDRKISEQLNRERGVEFKLAAK